MIRPNRLVQVRPHRAPRLLNGIGKTCHAAIIDLPTTNRTTQSRESAIADLRFWAQGFQGIADQLHDWLARLEATRDEVEAGQIVDRLTKMDFDFTLDGTNPLPQE